MVGCFQSIVVNKKFLFQFLYGQNKEISSSLLDFKNSKDEVDMDEPLSHSPEKEQGYLLNIVGYPDVGEPCMLVKGVIFLSFTVFVIKWIYLQICWRTRFCKRDIRT